MRASARSRYTCLPILPMNTRTILPVSVLVIASLIVRAQTPSAAPAAQAPADPDQAVFLRLCSDCHDRDRVTAMRRTRTEWEEVLDQMVSKGAVGSDRDFAAVLTYLLRNVGRVYVNSSTPDDLVSVLGTSPADAAAIVAYRKEHGNFRDVDALLKVPGIDVKLLEKQKDAMAF